MTKLDSKCSILFFLCIFASDMNRIEYWIKAQTQYRVHSPFVFDMYRKVLFAPLDTTCQRRMEQLLPHPIADRRDRPYHEIIFKLCDHYHLQVVCYDDDEAVLQGDPCTFGTLKVVCRPHRCHARELRWTAQQGDTKYNVSIDLYDVGLLLSHPKLHSQHFLLK